MLIDYIRQEGLPPGVRVMEVGCGWGLPGIYCAKTYQASVTSLDRDPEVFPFLHLHAEMNQVDITTLKKSFEEISIADLVGVDILMGVEICFWDEMVEVLEGLIEKALAAGVRLILIADPGRTPFDTLEERCLNRYHHHAISWRITRPYIYQGKILKIGSLIGQA